MIDRAVLVACLSKENYNRVASLIKKEYFPKEVATIIETLSHLHKNYEGDLTVDDLSLGHQAKYPALPEATAEKVGRELDM